MFIYSGMVTVDFCNSSSVHSTVGKLIQLDWTINFSIDLVIFIADLLYSVILNWDHLVSRVLVHNSIAILSFQIHSSNFNKNIILSILTAVLYCYWLKGKYKAKISVMLLCASAVCRNAGRKPNGLIFS